MTGKRLAYGIGLVQRHQMMRKAMPLANFLREVHAALVAFLGSCDASS